jgi:hypothetical protein
MQLAFYCEITTTNYFYIFGMATPGRLHAERGLVQHRLTCNAEFVQDANTFSKVRFAQIVFVFAI